MLRLTAESFFVSLSVACAVAVTAVMTQRYVAQQVDLGQEFRRASRTREAIQDARISQNVTRIEALERTVYGEQMKPPLPATIKEVGPALWQRNRDRELRERISALEKRFLRLESAFRDEGR